MMMLTANQASPCKNTTFAADFSSVLSHSTALAAWILRTPRASCQASLCCSVRDDCTNSCSGTTKVPNCRWLYRNVTCVVVPGVLRLHCSYRPDCRQITPGYFRGRRFGSSLGASNVGVENPRGLRAIGTEMCCCSILSVFQDTSRRIRFRDCQQGSRSSRRSSRAEWPGHVKPGPADVHG